MADVPLTRHKSSLRYHGLIEQPDGTFLLQLSPYLSIRAKVRGSDAPREAGGYAEHVAWLELTDGEGRMLERRQVGDLDGITRYWPGDDCIIESVEECRWPGEPWDDYDNDDLA